MGIKEDVEEKIASAFDTDLSDAVSDLTYVSVSQTYTPGANPNTLETNVSTRGVVSDISEFLIDGEAHKVGDKEVVILQNELSVVPKIDDKLIHGNRTYDVLSFDQDPVKSTWTLSVRFSHLVVAGIASFLLMSDGVSKLLNATGGFYITVG